MLYLTGIHDARQLRGFDPKSWTGVRRRIAIDLIDDVDRLGDPAAREALFERIVDARGAFKRTYRDRFAAFDDMLMAEWRRLQLGENTARVLDVAVSDGSTCVQLIERIDQETQGRFEFTATDLDGSYIKLYRAGHPEHRVIVADGGGIVQIVRPPFLFTHRESRYLFPVNRLLRPAAQRFAEALVADWKLGRRDVCAETILMLSPGFRKIVQDRPQVAFRAWNILEPWTGAKVHCLRAMNILNPSYFTQDEMRRVLSNFIDATLEGGIFAAGSNEDSGTPVDGVICRRRGSKLEVLTNSAKGFRMRDLLDELTFQQTT